MNEPESAIIMSSSDTGTQSGRSSALADLYVYSVGHEIAAIKLCGEAAARCNDAVGRLMLIELTLLRLEELNRTPPLRGGIRTEAPWVELEDVRRRLTPLPAGRTNLRRSPIIGRLRLVAHLLDAVTEFDRRAIAILRRLMTLFDNHAERRIVARLVHAKERWISLEREVYEYLTAPRRVEPTP